MYHNRVKMDPRRGRCFYFVTNRITGGQMLLGDAEKTKFCQLLFEGENRQAYRVWDFVVMQNHWHGLIEVDQADVMPRAEVLRRWQATQRRQDPGDPGDEVLEKFRLHIHDISFAIGNVEQRFSEWYNTSHERWGCLVGGRFHAVIVHEEMIALIMAYLTLNPVRAGIVTEPADYSWCGYARRVAAGALRCEDASLAPLMQKLLKLPEAVMEKISNGEINILWEQFREFFLEKPIDKSDKSAGTVAEYIEAMGGELELSWNARMNISARFVTQGIVIGPAEFVQQILEISAPALRYKRPHGPQASALWPGVFSGKKHQEPI